ncbi:MAG: hypothetical protein NC310_02890 [Roseburia sp.]|nr:hypothetical protein [Anaeroplasma bactoclasticum]MCM1196004.1 hypothetical protein [Roseburia sp.]MCM1556834.1 hypothetical protein [Anaeroplasma bactoclasticum]
MKTKTSINKLLCLGLCGFIIIDILLKIGLYDYKSASFAFLTFGLEMLIIIVIFYYNLISQASYGILNKKSNLKDNKRKLIISFGSAFLISFILFIIRVCLYYRINEYGNITWIILGCVHLLLMLIIGGLLYLSFYIASKRSNLSENDFNKKEEKIWNKSLLIAGLLILIDIIIKIIVWSISKDASNHWHFSYLNNEIGYAFYLFGIESIILFLFGGIVLFKEIKKNIIRGRSKMKKLLFIIGLSFIIIFGTINLTANAAEENSNSEDDEVEFMKLENSSSENVDETFSATDNIFAIEEDSTNEPQLSQSSSSGNGNWVDGEWWYNIMVDSKNREPSLPHPVDYSGSDLLKYVKRGDLVYEGTGAAGITGHSAIVYDVLYDWYYRQEFIVIIEAVSDGVCYGLMTPNRFAKKEVEIYRLMNASESQIDGAIEFAKSQIGKKISNMAWEESRFFERKMVLFRTGMG